MATWGSYDTLANYLTNGYWAWSGYQGSGSRKFDHTNITVNITNLSANDKGLVRQALDLWSDVSGLSFTETTGSADITFKTTTNGKAVTNMSTSGSTIDTSTVKVDKDWGGGQTATLDSYRFQTYIHEIGHALGLGHQGPYNNSATYPDDAAYTNDSWQLSVMSYFDQNENTAITGTRARVYTPQLVDIIAIQNLYGTSPSVRTGNTTYGDGNNTGRASYGTNFTNFPTVTIYDTGGIDTLNYSGDTGDQTIRLGAEQMSSVYGEINNIIIARGVTIENAVSGSGNDTIYGNSASNTLTGNAGNDRLFGVSGNDTLNGGTGMDSLYGSTGNDSLSGGAGNDRLYGSQGNDRLNGGTGDDYLSGGDGSDVLAGDDGVDSLYGGSGLDILKPGQGGIDEGDVYDGGADTDYLDMTDLTAGYTIDLASGFVKYFFPIIVPLGEGARGTAPALSGITATLSNIENVWGAGGNDNITGDANANYLWGYDGNDTIDGGAGNDTLSGGDGNDRLTGGGGIDNYYGGAGNDRLSPGSSGIGQGEIYNGGSGTDTLDMSVMIGDGYTINLTTGVLQWTGAFPFPITITASMSSIENVTGAGGADTITGDSGDNVLRGGTGDDRIIGEDGLDKLYGGSGDDTLLASSDSSGIDDGEVYDGGAGIDTLDLSTLTAGYTVNLGTGTFNWSPFILGASGAASDLIIPPIIITPVNATVSGIENIIGGAGNDSLTGDAGANVIDAGKGNDKVYYDLASSDPANADSYDGGLGTDTFLVTNAALAPHVVDLAAGEFRSGTDVIATLTGFENVSVTGAHKVIGDGKANVINGVGNYDNDFSGGFNADTLNGGDGNDTLRGGFSTDSVNGGNGDDLIIVESGEFFDNVDGGAGVDTLDHSAVTRSGDVFDFDAGQIITSYATGTPTLAGIEVYQDGSGGNEIRAAGGVDGNSYYGNDGDDLMVASGTAIETMDGGAGFDTLDLRGFAGNYVYSMASGNTQILGESFLNFEKVLTGAGKDRITGTAGGDEVLSGAGRDIVKGMDGADRLSGQGGNDRLFGGGGNDKLFGGGQTDRLIGGQGKDVLKGGAGRDILDGGGGNDRMFGGNGVDTFLFKAGGGKDVILDFADDIDVVKLDQSLWGGGMTKAQVISTFATTTVGGDVVLDFGGGNALTIVGLGSENNLLNDLVLI